jgi:hypothetical protein
MNVICFDMRFWVGWCKEVPLSRNTFEDLHAVILEFNARPCDHVLGRRASLLIMNDNARFNSLLPYVGDQKLR